MQKYFQNPHLSRHYFNSIDSQNNCLNSPSTPCICLSIIYFNFLKPSIDSQLLSLRNCRTKCHCGQLPRRELAFVIAHVFLHARTPNEPRKVHALTGKIVIKRTIEKIATMSAMFLLKSLHQFRRP